MKDKILIFGHKNPDTDSVCSAISLAYLKQQLGFNAEARILSSINDETKFVLKKAKITTPELLNDVRVKINDINYHKNYYVNINEPVINAYNKMIDNNVSSIPIINDNFKFIGVFTMKDIAKKQINNCNSIINSTYEYIKKSINGKEITKYNDVIIGDIKSNSIDLNKNSILITNNIDDFNKGIDNKVLLIIYSGLRLKEDIINNINKNKINVINVNDNINNILIKLDYSNLINTYNYETNFVCINENSDLNDLNEIINKTKHSYYPVINNKKNCLGLIQLSDLSDIKKKNVILVDHNEINQSVDGIEEAEIIGIVDHHKIATLGTLEPIDFRNMTVGSTCTIVYHMFKENNIPIPNDIGLLLLSGLISDTLLLKSPTTTEDDKKVYNALSKLLNINVKNYAIEMFKANDVTKSKTLKEIIYTDIKTFTIDKKTIAISQITTLNSKAILKQKNSYIRYLNKESENKEYDIIILSIVDIFKEGSYILFNSKSIKNIKNAFGDDVEQGEFIKGMVSRKKQILPLIINSLH